MLRRLESHLAAMGVEICMGFEIQKLSIDGERCTGAVLDTPGKPRTVHADSVILASGKFSHLLEGRLGNECASELTIGVSKELQPVSSHGVVLANNLFACGSVLGRLESRYGNAIAIVSGHQAGMLAWQRGVHYAKP